MTNSTLNDFDDFGSAVDRGPSSVRPDRVRRKVAMVCLVPDAGHVVPLTRIARALRKYDLEFTFIVPDELLDLVKAAGLEVCGYGCVRPPNADALVADVCAARWQFQRRARNRRLWSEYYAPLLSAVISKLGAVSVLLEEIHPALMIADDHLFQAELKTLASVSSTPLLLHSAMGSLYPWRPPFWDLPASTRYAYKAQNLVTDAFLALWRRILPRRQSKPPISGAREEEKATRLVPPQMANNVEVTRIATGLAPLELVAHADNLPADAAEVRFFGPIEPVAAHALDLELEDFLNADDPRPIVYVSFGSMVPSSSRLIKQIIDAAKSISVRIVMASKGGANSSGCGSSKRDVYLGQWLPQVAILCHPRVVAFVTHGGAGALQESLWFGKPVLVIPRIWDQRYNADLASIIGFGLRLSPNKANSRNVREYLSRLVWDQSLRRMAEECGAKLRSLNGAEKLSETIVKLVDDTNTQVNW